MSYIRMCIAGFGLDGYLLVAMMHADADRGFKMSWELRFLRTDCLVRLSDDGTIKSPGKDKKLRHCKHDHTKPCQ
jgi:hypothetical protein